LKGHGFTACGRGHARWVVCVRARIYSCRKAFRINQALALAGPWLPRKRLFPQAVQPCRKCPNKSRASALFLIPQVHDADVSAQLGVVSDYPECMAISKVVNRNSRAVNHPLLSFSRIGGDEGQSITRSGAAFLQALYRGAYLMAGGQELQYGMAADKARPADHRIVFIAVSLWFSAEVMRLAPSYSCVLSFLAATRPQCELPRPTGVRMGLG